MTNEELHDKVIETNLAVTRIEGDIKNLTTAVNGYVVASGKAEERLDLKIDKVESQVNEKIGTIDKRIWGSLVSGVGGLLTALWSVVKH